MNNTGAADKHQSITIEIVLGALTWVLLYVGESLTSFVLRERPSSVGYYQITIAATILLACLVPFLGKKRLVIDIVDICIYDIIVQVIGLLCSTAQVTEHIYHYLAIFILLLKLARVAWPLACIASDRPTWWPPIGPVGLYWQWRHGFSPLARGQRRAVYTLIGQLAILGLVGQILFAIKIIPYTGLITAFFVLYYTNRLIGKLEAREEETNRIIAEKVAAESKVELANAKLANQAALEAKNKELEAALKQRDQANAELASKNAALASANAALEALSQERATLARDLATRNERLADATHDIQQPLMFLGYKANAILASALTDEQRADAQELKEELRGLGDRMVRITAEAQTGEIPPPPALNLPVADLRSYFFERFNSLALDHEVTLKCLIKPDWNANFALQTNGDLLKRVIGNLLFNAITNANEADWVFLIFHRCGNHCFVRIWDTGNGIGDFNSPDRAANFRALLATKPDSQPEPDTGQPATMADGHGIGLHSVARLCEQLGITMQLKARTGQGTLYRFKLPLA